MKKNVPVSDFFARQESARQATRRLVLWFAFGLLGTATAIYFVVRAAMTAAGFDESLTHDFFPDWNDAGDALWIDPVLFAVVFGITLVIVGGVSLFKSLEYGNSTGEDVAEALGGRAVSWTLTAADERRLINVVQEMSLASGVPVPKIFILEKEKSINAFAAGTRTDRAAIAVSRGALNKLSRDELQAVIGHEFSHILNGDMRLNIRLVGWIFGLLAISLVGNILLRVAMYSPRGRSRDGKGGSNAGLALIFLGVGLAFLVVGFISRIFSQMIQAAVSRNRERLADASSTQFTRNPRALASALARIGGDENHGRISSPHAGEFAHLFFADAVGSLFATHPPLEERIRALDPDWDGRFLPPLSRKENYAADDAETPNEKTPPPRRVPRILRRADAVPLVVRELAQRSADAKALVYLLLMTDSPSHNVEQAKILLARESRPVFKKMESLWASMKNFPEEKRIDAVLLAAPALRELPVRERIEFCETLDELARADGKFSLYEFCVLCTVKSLLADDGEKNLSAAEVSGEIELVLNLFLSESGLPANTRANALDAALAANPRLPRGLHVVENFSPAVAALDSAFRKLRSANILVRENLIGAAEAIVRADGVKTATEEDLVTALAAVLNCPRQDAQRRS